MLHAQNQTSAEIAEATGRHKSSITRLPLGDQIATCAPDTAILPLERRVATCAPDCHVSTRLPLLRRVAAGAPDCHLGAGLPFVDGGRGGPGGPVDPEDPESPEAWDKGGGPRWKTGEDLEDPELLDR